VRNCARDEGRSLGVGLQEQAPNHLKLRWLRARVVSIKEKSRRKIAAGMGQGDERKRTTDEVSKHPKKTSKLGAYLTPGQAQGEPAYCLGGVRHRGGVTLVQALGWNVGTCRPDVKGETQVERPTRVRVPRRGTGAEQPVVARKSRNGDGAKGLYRSALLGGQPDLGRSR
jgi:hypothetical protein